MSKSDSEKKGKRKVQRGATRTSVKTQNMRYLKPALKIASGITLCAVIVVNIDFKSQLEKVKAIANRPVAQISIEGKFKYISREKIQKLLEQYVQENFVDIDLRGLKQGIELSPWIEEASVSRVWPDRLEVSIREELPIARWRNDAFINRFGEKVLVEDNSMLASLPQLSGPEGMERDIANYYIEISSMLNDQNLQLVGVAVDETRSWALEFKDQKRVLLGEGNLVEKLDLFIDVLNQHLDGSLKSIKKADLRYESGMAVEWINSEASLAFDSNVSQQKYASK